ncbi:MAG: methyltransferase domain-containing protein [Calditrichaeota bacterium]|nr:methyltransferase domain-containing protein [Calditrichota bacterium]
MNRRQFALTILTEWLKTDRFIDHLLEKRFSDNPGLEETDKSWVQASLYGTLERFFAIRSILDQVSKNRFKKNKKLIQAILMLAVYELLFTENQEYAIVNEYVKLCKLNKQAYQVKIVNALLRQVADQKETLLSEINQSTDLSVRFNIPIELHQLLLDENKEADLLDWYRILPGKRSIWLRHNRLKSTKEPVFERIDDFQSIKADLENGLISIQDFAAGKVVEFMSPKAKSRILDYCGAPGSKSTYIAELTDDSAEIVATDVNPLRLEKINQNINRLGLQSIQTKLTSELQNDEQFDQVLCDIPCSGLGVIGKRKDLLLRFSEAKLSELSKLQIDILDEVSRFVKVNGQLILSTCTILNQENMGLAKRFLESHLNFKIKGDPLELLPFSGEHDGAFAICLERLS